MGVLEGGISGGVRGVLGEVCPERVRGVLEGGVSREGKRCVWSE